MVRRTRPDRLTDLGAQCQATYSRGSAKKRKRGKVMGSYFWIFYFNSALILDDGPEETQQQLHHYQHPPSPTITDDVNIHVEKELVTGGGVCAKIVFFFLLTALAVLIGLIITEHRELSDRKSLIAHFHVKLSILFRTS